MGQPSGCTSRLVAMKREEGRYKVLSEKLRRKPVKREITKSEKRKKA